MDVVLGDRRQLDHQQRARRELHHDGEHVSLGRFLPDSTVVCTGLSKWCGAGGWRLRFRYTFAHNASSSADDFLRVWIVSADERTLVFEVCR